MTNPSRKYDEAIAPPEAAAAGAPQLDGATPALPRSATSLGDRILFLRGFLAQPRQVASVVPSSAVLERRLAAAAGIARARTIVELGPGTGGTTRALLRAARPEARLLLVELSPMFHARLCRRIRDPRLTVQLGSAELLERFLDERRLPPPDAVLSGIPFSTIAADTADRIAAAIARCLAPGGRFVAYQVRPAVAGYLAPYLGAPETAWEWRNVPPVRVFRWVKPAPA